MGGGAHLPKQYGWVHRNTNVSEDEIMEFSVRLLRSSGLRHIHGLSDKSHVASFEASESLIIVLSLPPKLLQRTSVLSVCTPRGSAEVPTSRQAETCPPGVLFRFRIIYLEMDPFL